MLSKPTNKRVVLKYGQLQECRPPKPYHSAPPSATNLHPNLILNINYPIAQKQVQKNRPGGQFYSGSDWFDRSH
jgi:hypothetical protein